MNKTTGGTEYFDSLAASWGNRFTKSGSMRDRLTRFQLALTSRLTPGARVLDFGCGTGEITTACALAGFELVGVDRSAQMVQKARDNTRGGHTRFEVLADRPGPLRLPFEDKEFAGVLASSVLEYITDAVGVFTEMHRVTADAAWIFVTVPNVWHPIRIAEWLALKLSPILRSVLPARLRSHLVYIQLSINRFGAKRWSALLKSAHWDCVEVSGYLSPLILIVARKPS
jgi:ubiquinone/menaquinone biosynthesis C-methylase UbiE